MKVTINNKMYSCGTGFISGAQIKRMANIALNDVVFFKVRGTIQEIEINDNDFVDLSRLGETFLSRCL